MTPSRGAICCRQTASQCLNQPLKVIITSWPLSPSWFPVLLGKFFSTISPLLLATAIPAIRPPASARPRPVGEEWIRGPDQGILVEPRQEYFSAHHCTVASTECSSFNAHAAMMVSNRGPGWTIPAGTIVAYGDKDAVAQTSTILFAAELESVEEFHPFCGLSM